MSSNVLSSLSVHGDRTSGDNIRKQNVLAAVTIANIVKTSLGPVGLDKMLVDDVGEVTISNDGATILKLLEVEHSAAKILVELAQLQDDEVGDGTTSVVLMAAEFLKNADEQVCGKIHPTLLISGYRIACREACKYLLNNLTLNVDELGEDCIVNAAKTAMSSKLIGVDADFFAKMAVDAALAIKMPDKNGGFLYPINAINILKAHGKSMRDSEILIGYALNCTVASLQMPKYIKNAKIALLDFNLQKTRLKLGIQILVSDPENLDEIRKRESDITKERIEKILKAGANVILTTGGIDDLCMKYFVEANAMAVRRCKKVDLKRLAKATGGSLLCTMSTIEDEEESFDASLLGEAEEVFQKRVCDDEMIIIKNTKVRCSASILLRGANDFYVDEMERSMHDALCVIKRVLESKSVVPGGGTCEVALSVFLENFSISLETKEQIAIAEFARSLLTIPKQLAVNASLDSTDLVSKLRAYHHASQTQTDKVDLKWWGLDLQNGTIADNKLAGIFEPTMIKIKSLKFATEAAITILRIDDLIKLKEEKEQKNR